MAKLNTTTTLDISIWIRISKSRCSCLTPEKKLHQKCSCLKFTFNRKKNCWYFPPKSTVLCIYNLQNDFCGYYDRFFPPFFKSKVINIHFIFWSHIMSHIFFLSNADCHSGRDILFLSFLYSILVNCLGSRMRAK